MEHIVVKIEPEELVDDILMKYDVPSTSADQEMPSSSGIAVEHEIKVESDDDEVLLNKGQGSMMYYVRSKTNDSDEESEDFDHKIEDSLYNIKEEERYCDVSEEDDKNLSNNEEKYEDEAMIESKIEVEYHGLECYESGADSEVVNKETPSKTEEKGFEKNPGHECKRQLGLSREKECLKAIAGVGEVKLFECDICPKKCRTRVGLNYHKKYNHEKDKLEQLKCGHCAFVTEHKSYLNTHLKIHDKEKYLRCHFCEFMTTKLTNLNAHIISRHKSENKGKNKIKITSKTYQCSNCSYSTVKKTNYEIHIKVCLKSVIYEYKCHLCPYKTIYKFNLKTHLKTHNKKKEFKCLFCPKESNHKSILDNHILMKHSDLLNESNRSIITSKMHSCHNCNYKTTHTCKLKKHLHEIYKLDQLKCQHCAFVTGHKGYFNKHLKIHDKKKYLRCNFCEFITARLINLNAHIISRHKSENKGENKIKITSKIYQCSNCAYSSVYKASYDAHIKVCLKLENVQQYECHLCQYKTIHKFHLKSHIKTHNKTKQFKCLFCSRESNQKYNLDNHILITHSHLLNESNRNIITSKVHSCHHCNFKTTHISDLKKHLNRHT